MNLLSSRLIFSLSFIVIGYVINSQKAIAESASTKNIDSDAPLKITQIIPDNSLGNENSTIRQDIINDLPSDIIEGGATRGSHLFHSFREFNINEGRGAYFANPDVINNIFTRVTGGNISHILGTLGVLGNANLFLINPNGIIFGKNARLDMRGAFVGSTADSVMFNNNYEFSATNPNTPPLLTVDIPLGLRVREKTGDISSNASLYTPSNLMLQARNLNLSGSITAGENLTLEALNTLTVRDSLTLPFQAVAGNNLRLQGNQSIDIFALNHPNSGLISAGNLTIRSNNPVGGDAHFWSGGSFRIEKLDGSLGNLYSPNDPIIQTLGNVEFGIYQGASLHILAGGSVNIDTILITGTDTVTNTINPITTPELANVTLSDGTKITIDGNVQPTLDIRAGIDPNSLRENSFFSIQLLNNNLTTTHADIKIREIKMLSPNGWVFLTNQYQPNLSLLGGDINLTGKGLAVDGRGILGNQGSNVILDARRGINLVGTIDTSSVDFSAVGGNITLLSNQNLNISNGATIESVGLSGGKIALKSHFGHVFIDDGILLSLTVGAETGKGIDIFGQSIKLSNFARVATLTLGNGEAGDINIQAFDQVEIINQGGISQANLSNPLASFLEPELRGTGIATTTGFPPNLTAPFPAGDGKAGNITIKADQLNIFNVSDNLRERTGINTATLEDSLGQGGNILVDITERITIVGNDPTPFEPDFGQAIVDQLTTIPAGISASTFGDGSAGKLTINAHQLEVRNNAYIASGSFSLSDVKGEGGELTVNVNDSIQLRGIAGLASATIGARNAGNLTVNVPTGKISIEEGAFIVTGTLGSGSAGSLNINTRELQIRKGSLLSSETSSTGDGETITIRGANFIDLGENTNLTVETSGRGRSGSINIETNTLTIGKNARLSATATQSSTNIEGGGSIDLNANIINISGELGIFAETQSNSPAGNLTLQPNSNSPNLNICFTNNGFISARTLSGGEGGDINISAPQTIDIQGFGQITAETLGEGNAGTIDLQAQTLTLGDGVKISAATAPNSTGSGGNIFIDSIFVIVTDGAVIAVNDQGAGNGGDIFLNAQNLSLNNNSEISAATASGEGGNITLNITDTLRQRNNSDITATAGGTGNGGNITFNTQYLIGSNNSEITANAFAGNGGNIQIFAQGIFRDLSSEITASSELGVDGIVDTNTPDVDPSRGLIDLPQNIVDPNALISQNACRQGNKSEFTVRGRGGLPSSPEQVQGSDEVSVNLIEPTEDLTTPEATIENPFSEKERKIVPAQGWQKNEKGEFILVAYPPEQPINLSGNSSVNCSSNERSNNDEN